MCACVALFQPVCVCVCMKMYALLCVAQGGHAKAKMRGASLPELILR